MALNDSDSKAPATKSTSSEKAASAEAEQKRRLAVVLEDINVFLRSTATTRDFFEGYSLSEAIQERLDIIGGDAEAATQAPDGKLTLLGELEILRATGLAAISAAKQYDTLEQEPEDSEDDGTEQQNAAE